MVHIDLNTLTKLHTVYDNITLGNIELAHKQLSDILSKEQKIVQVKHEKCYCGVKKKYPFKCMRTDCNMSIIEIN